MTQHKQREKAVFYIYQTLLRSEIDDSVSVSEFEELTPEFRKVVNYAIDDQEDLEDLLNDHLKGWTFDRLGFIEQAILLVACAEVIVNQTPKQVIIDESILFSKEYGEQDDTYKLINATLDKVLDV